MDCRVRPTGVRFHAAQFQQVIVSLSIVTLLPIRDTQRLTTCTPLPTQGAGLSRLTDDLSAVASLPLPLGEVGPKVRVRGQTSSVFTGICSLTPTLSHQEREPCFAECDCPALRGRLEQAAKPVCAQRLLSNRTPVGHAPTHHPSRQPRAAGAGGRRGSLPTERRSSGPAGWPAPLPWGPCRPCRW